MSDTVTRSSRAWLVALVLALAVDAALVVLIAPELDRQVVARHLVSGWIVGLLVVAAMIGVPTAMVARSTRARALAVAVLGATAAMYPLAMFGFFVFAFSGFEASLLLVPLTLAVLTASIVGYRRLDASMRSGGDWLMAVLLVALWIVATTLGYRALQHEITTTVANANTNDRAALTALAEIARCAGLQMQRTGAYPRTLEAFDGGCLDATTLAAGHAGHTIDYAPGLEDSEGRVPIFAAMAVPRVRGRTGWQSALVDDLGPPVSHLEDGTTDVDKPALLLATEGSGARLVRWCVLRAAARLGRYPADLQELQSADPGCLPWRTPNRVWHESPDGQYSYLADAFDGHRGFAMTVRMATNGVSGFYMDSRGRVDSLGAFAPGRPSAGAERTESPQQIEAEQADAAALQRGCAVKLPWFCLVLARLTAYGAGDAARDYARAAELMQSACDLGLGTACSDLRTLLTVDLARGASADQRRVYDARARGLALTACDLGDGEGCDDAGADALAESSGDARERGLELFLRGCELMHEWACNRLAQIVLGRDERFPDGLDRAQSELVLARVRALCEHGSVDGCYFTGRLLSRPGATVQERREAMGVLFAGCDAWRAAGCVEAAQLRLEAEGKLSPVTLEIAERGRCAPPLDGLAVCGEVRSERQRRCDADDGHACLGLATDFMGDDLDRAPPNAGWQLVERACALGVADACDLRR